MCKNNKTYMHIGDLAKKLQTSTRAIRYYEELELIVPRRTDSGYREYSEKEADKIKTILQLKKLGLTLEEIKELILNKSKDKLLKTLHNRINEFEEKVKDYKKGIKEIKSMIQLIEDCSLCKEETDMFKCTKCIEKMPDIMKAML